MEWIWTKANEKELARFATDSALQLFDLDVSSFDLIRQEQFESLIENIYNTLVAQKIKYDLEKFNLAETHQRIRTPVEILSNPGQGTCLDLALLFCGLCLGCNLLPKLILLEGHALAVVSLTLKREDWNSNRDSQKKFLGKRVNDSQGMERIEPEVFKDLENLKTLKNLIDDGIYCVVECTGFAYSKTLQANLDPELAGFERNINGFFTFEQAKKVGRQQLERLHFKYAIDIAVAHESWGIKPETLEIPDRWNQITTMYAKQDIGKLNNAKAIGNIDNSNGLALMNSDQKVDEVSNGAELIGNQNGGKILSGNTSSKQVINKVEDGKITGQEFKHL